MTLSQLDPNIIAVLGTILTAGATWLYHKVKGDKQESLTDSIWHVLDGVVIKLAESDDTVDALRAKLAQAALDGMNRMGIKQSALTDMIVAQLVEKGVTEVRKRILARKTLEAAVANAATQAAAVKDAFTPKGTIPKIGDGLPGEVQLTTVAP